MQANEDTNDNDLNIDVINQARTMLTAAYLLQQIQHQQEQNQNHSNYYQNLPITTTTQPNNHHQILQSGSGNPFSVSALLQHQPLQSYITNPTNTTIQGDGASIGPIIGSSPTTYSTITVCVYPPKFPWLITNTTTQIRDQGEGAQFSLHNLPPFQFQIDRHLLASKSSYFASALLLHPYATVLSAPNTVSPTAFKILQDFMETGELKLSEHNSVHVLSAAAVLGIKLIRLAHPAVVTNEPCSSISALPKRVRLHLDHSVPDYHQPSLPKTSNINNIADNDNSKEIEGEISSSPEIVGEPRQVFTIGHFAKRQSPPFPSASSAESPKKFNEAAAATERAICDGPVKFYRVLNENYRPEACQRSLKNSGNNSRNSAKFYPCRTCGRKFPSYYFVHKHKQSCDLEYGIDPSTSDEHSAIQSIK